MEFTIRGVRYSWRRCGLAVLSLFVKLGVKGGV